MINKILNKICICLFIIPILLISIGCSDKVDEKKLKKDSEWINETYSLWIDNDSKYYINEEAAFELFNYLVDEKKFESKYLNYVYLDDCAIYFMSKDGEHFVAYEVEYKNGFLKGDITYLGYNKSLEKLVNKYSTVDNLFYEINDDGTSKANSYLVTFKDPSGNIIKQVDQFGYKVDTLLINEGKTVSYEYSTTNYRVEGSKTIAKLFKGWECNGEILKSPITVTSDMVLTAVVEEKAGIVSNGREVFNSFDDAFKNSAAGDTLVLMQDVTVKDLVIPEGITLLIPADNNNNILQIPGDKDASKLPINDKPFVTLTVDNLTVNGSLLIASVIGYPGSGGACQGHTSGSHGLLVVNDKLTVNGLVDSSGYIKGTGKAYVHGTLNCPFIVRDFRGGTNTLGVYTNGNISPFNVYELINVEIETVYYSDATLNAYGNLYAASQYNVAKSPVIGKGGVIVLDEGSTATVKYDSALGHGSITLNGGATDGNFSLTVMGVVVTIEGVFFPLPYTFDIILEDGTYNLNSSYKLLTGSKFIVKEDAVCNLNNDFIIYSEFKDTGYAGSCYPDLAPALFEVEGKLNINHALAGEVTLSKTGEIKVSKTSVKDTNEDVKLTLTSKEGYADSSDVSGLHITSEITLIATYKKDGKTYEIEIGKSYK